jgi:hypothetical protein
MPKRATMAETIPIKGRGAVVERLPTPSAPPPPIPTVALTFRAPADMHERLRRLAFDTRQPVQRLIEEAVTRYLASVDAN